MNVVAKFTCTENRQIPRYPQKELGDKPEDDCVTECIEMHAVYEDDGPNKKWASATPSGEVKMTIDNPGAQKFFVPGAEYLVTFQRLPKDNTI